MPSALQLKMAWSVSKLQWTRSQRCCGRIGRTHRRGIGWGGSGGASASAAHVGAVVHLQRRALGGFHHADPGIGRAQERQTRRVSRDHARRVQLDGHDGFGRRRPLADAVAGAVEVVGRQRMETKHAGLFGEGPLGVIGDVVPLPVRIELAAVEVVVMDERRLGILGDAGVGLDPGVGGLAQIARQADEREAVVPGDGNQGDHSPRAAVVGHDDAPPLAGGGIDHAALVEGQAAVAGGGASGRRGGHAERFALDHAFDRPGTVDGIGTGDHLIGSRAGDGGDVVVLAVDLVEVVAFAHSWASSWWRTPGTKDLRSGVSSSMG